MQKRLYRSQTDRVISGVCGGLANYLDLDPSLVRIATALLALMSFGTVALVYIVMALIVPQEPVI